MTSDLPSQTEEPSRPEMVDELSANARAWILLDEEERRAKIALKEVLLKKKTLSNSILKGLEVVNEPHISFQRGGMLRPCEHVSYARMSREETYRIIRESVEDDSQAQAIVGKLYDKTSREARKSVALRFNRT